MQLKGKCAMFSRHKEKSMGFRADLHSKAALSLASSITHQSSVTQIT